MRMNHDEPASRRAIAGSVALFAGIALLVLILLDVTCDFLPRSWYYQRTLWGALALVLCAAGWRWLRTGGGVEAGWRPKVPGRRFSRLKVYSRSECHLCDDAKAVLAIYLEYLPEIQEVDIETD